MKPEELYGVCFSLFLGLLFYTSKYVKAWSGGNPTGSPYPVPKSKQVCQRSEASTPTSGPFTTIINQGDTSDWFGIDGSEAVSKLFEPGINAVLENESKKWTFVMFYTTGCKLSTNVKPNFSAAARQLRNEGVDLITFAAVNCDINPSTCEAQEIDGYPTFNLYYGGQLVEEYEEDRSYQSFANYGRNPPKPSWFAFF